MPSKPTPKKRTLDELACIFPNAAGLDIGSAEIVAAVPPDRDAEPVRVWSECGERGSAAHMRDPWSWLDGRCDLRNRSVGNAQHDKLGIRRSHGEATLGKASGHS